MAQATVEEILSALRERSISDQTHLKWFLIPDDQKDELRKKWEQDHPGQDMEALVTEFKHEVDQIHSQRDVQQEQRQQMGHDVPGEDTEEPSG